MQSVIHLKMSRNPTSSHLEDVFIIIPFIRVLSNMISP